MEKNTQVLDAALRNSIFADLITFINEHFETDALLVANNEITMPVVDSEGNEKFANIKISIPRGTRKGKGKGYEPYDGYVANKEYLENLAIQQEKEKEKERKRKEREAEKQ